MNDNGGDGEGTPSAVTGFTRYVTSEEFRQFCDESKRDRGRLNNALWGTEGTNGMVKDVHDLKMWIKFLGIIGGIVSPIVTAIIIKFVLGGI